MIKKTLINLKNVKFTLESGRTLFKGVSLTVSAGEKIGLVGRNGSGKTTLLRLIERKMDPSTVFYLPQIDLEKYKSSESVQDYIKKYRPDWWEVVTDIDEKAVLKTLSGGELMRLNLSIGQARDPDLFLLDEPTNHLDIKAIAELFKFIKESKKSFVIVSHHPYFLDKTANTIWELDNQQVSVYGGDYSDYVGAKDNEKSAQKRDYKAAQKRLRKVKLSFRAEEERAARSRRVGETLKKAGSQSMSRMEMGFFKNKSAQSSAQRKKAIQRKMRVAYQKVAELKPRERKSAFLDLKTDTSRKRRLIVDIREADLVLPNNKKLIDNFSLQIYYGDRLAIAGNNGSGKTSLVKMLDPSSAVYIDQKYDLVDPEKSLIENVQKYNPDISYEQVRRQLGSFLFRDDVDIFKRAGELSGGEVACLTFAMVTASEVDLLVLDEPVNNLDLETVEVIAEELRDFPGAIVAISHHIDFLSQIGVDVCYHISESKLKRMQSTPEDADVFYQELVKLSSLP